MRGPVWVILFGLVFFGIGAGLTYRQFMIRQDALEVTGEVYKLNQSCDDDGCTYSPIVRFTTQMASRLPIIPPFLPIRPLMMLANRLLCITSLMIPSALLSKGRVGFLVSYLPALVGWL